MRADHVFAGIPVADYAAARPWYERLAGRAPDMVPHGFAIQTCGVIEVVNDVYGIVDCDADCDRRPQRAELPRGATDHSHEPIVPGMADHPDPKVAV